MKDLGCYDVVIVGCGPVGVTAAHLLGHRGLSVLVIERDLVPYNLPRAVHMDHEIMRIFQSAGLSDLLLPLMTMPEGSVHFGADGAPIRPFRRIVRTDRLGWASDYFFYQPDLERTLRGALRDRPTVTLKVGHSLEQFTQDGDEVAICGTAPDGPFRASCHYLLACDGGRSSVRKLLKIDLVDLGFDEPWIVVDAVVEGKVKMPSFSGLPDDVDVQKVMFILGNPARPTTYVPSSGQHRRWEFMLLPEESPEHVARPEMADELLAPWLQGEPYTLIRSAVYRFHSLLAERWQVGRVLLLGDAAHQTPPFFGQGLCHGIRDAANLAWKLDLVRRGCSREELLLSYEIERLPHARQVIETSIRTGRYICTLDPEAARRRDEEMRGDLHRAVRGDIIPPITAGVISAAYPSLAVGLRFIQPPVRLRTGETKLLDFATGGGFVLLSMLDFTEFEWPKSASELPLRSFKVLPKAFHNEPGIDEVVDSSEELAVWFSQYGCAGVLIRPDFYVFGTFTNCGEARLLIDELLHIAPISRVGSAE
jgi:3-(3-hydroxy-phenyl)propionate hydroxylase